MRMLLLDPWSKAAECDRAIERVADPERRIVLESLRSVWVEVGDCLSLCGGPEASADLSLIEKIHTELMAGCWSAMH
jgi:hypothetical protein